jgi:chromosomal replication initiation ATPase DnaA
MQAHAIPALAPFSLGELLIEVRHRREALRATLAGVNETLIEVRQRRKVLRATLGGVNDLLAEPDWGSLHAGIIQRAAREFGVDPAAISDRRRGNARISLARQMAMAAIHHSGRTFQEAATACGRDDHGTAIHAVRRIQKLILTDPEAAGQWQRIIGGNEQSPCAGATGKDHE